MPATASVDQIDGSNGWNVVVRRQAAFGNIVMKAAVDAQLGSTTMRPISDNTGRAGRTLNLTFPNTRTAITARDVRHRFVFRLAD